MILSMSHRARSWRHVQLLTALGSGLLMAGCGLWACERPPAPAGGSATCEACFQGPHRGTRCAPRRALRSDSHGESEHDARCARGALKASPAGARPMRGKGQPARGFAEMMLVNPQWRSSNVSATARAGGLRRASGGRLHWQLARPGARSALRALTRGGCLNAEPSGARSEFHRAGRASCQCRLPIRP